MLCIILRKYSDFVQDNQRIWPEIAGTRLLFFSFCKIRHSKTRNENDFSREKRQETIE